MQNFFEWIVFDFPIDEDSNKTLIDYYLEQNRKLSLDEHKGADHDEELYHKPV